MLLFFRLGRAVSDPPIDLLSCLSTRRSATSGSSKLSPDVSDDKGAGSDRCWMNDVVSSGECGEENPSTSVCGSGSAAVTATGTGGSCSIGDEEGAGSDRCWMNDVVSCMNGEENTSTPACVSGSDSGAVLSADSGVVF